MRFSVITVCKDDVSGLRETWSSVVDQTYDDFEWIVVDGGSTDGSLEWLRSQDLATWSSEPDSGLYDAMNKGIDRATGDYLIFLNSGDCFASTSVLHELSITAAEVADVDFFYGDAIDVFPDGGEYYRPARTHRSLRLGMFTQHQAMVFARESVGNLRYDTAFDLSADYGFVCAFLSRGEVVVHRVAYPICRYAVGGMSTRLRRRAIAEDYAIRRSVLRLGLIASGMLWVAHQTHRMIKVRASALHRFVRYRSVASK